MRCATDNHHQQHIIIIIIIIIIISLVSIATGYGLDGQDYIPDTGKKFFFTPQRPDQRSGPTSLLFNAYRGCLRG
jgi:TM2 domain-containing membrane protein YozV